MRIMPPAAKLLRLQSDAFRPGMRIAVACSGGADSVALLRTLLELGKSLGLVLSVAHMNHGIRGKAAEDDCEFVERLAKQYGLAFHIRSVDTPSVGKATGEGLEEAARHLRYAWFWGLLAAGEADAIVTAHTLDDQAETVLHRLIRGAWTEGLGGIFPILAPPSRQSGTIVRPFLETSRSEIESWLRAIEQPWREDESNRDLNFTRNRIRHELLPELASYNPAVRVQLAQTAALAREDDTYWQAELARLPSLLLPGKAVRGGGRATDTLVGDASISIEVERLAPLYPALRRRVLRAAAGQLGCSIDFGDTERLLVLCGLSGRQSGGRTGAKLHLDHGLRAERTPRELKLFRGPTGPQTDSGEPSQYELAIPGRVEAPAFGMRLEATIGQEGGGQFPAATLRAAKPGDRVTLRQSRSALKINEALRRARLPVRSPSPVLEWEGEIVWVPGLMVESAKARDAVLRIVSTPLL